jgi:hypothetical protein
MADEKKRVEERRRYVVAYDIPTTGDATGWPVS